jgi:hypothetical protein
MRSRRQPVARSPKGGSSGIICWFRASSAVRSAHRMPASTLMVRSAGSYWSTRVKADVEMLSSDGSTGPGHREPSCRRRQAESCGPAAEHCAKPSANCSGEEGWIKADTPRPRP